MGCGVLLGASTPNQLVVSTSSKALVSARAGKSGNRGDRFLLVTAMPFSVPACSRGTAGGKPEMVSLTCPLTASFSAGAAPR